MAIEDILEALEEQGQADCDECLDEARAHAEHILAEARREADEIGERHVEQVVRVTKAQAAKQVNSARLEAKMRISSVKGEGLETVFDRAGERLASVREAPGYPQLFERLGREALEGVDGSVVVHVASDDVDLARRLLESTGHDGRVEGDIETAGGVLVELDGGAILRRNTLEDRLGRARELVQADAAKVLLG